jgi:hypothetical protein
MSVKLNYDYEWLKLLEIVEYRTIKSPNPFPFPEKVIMCGGSSDFLNKKEGEMRFWEVMET